MSRPGGTIGRRRFCLWAQRFTINRFPGPLGATNQRESRSVKEHLEELLAQSMLHLQREGVLPSGDEPEIQLERTRSPDHGEFATNLAMVYAKPAGMPPRELAQAIIDRQFVEVLIATGYEPAALAALAAKKNVRVLEIAAAAARVFRPGINGLRLPRPRAKKSFSSVTLTRATRVLSWTGQSSRAIRIRSWKV